MARTFRNFFGLLGETKEGTSTVTAFEETRGGQPKSYIPNFFYRPPLESFLNGGLYKNICQKLNKFVKNVKKSSLLGNAKIENFVQMNVEQKYIRDFSQENIKTQRSLNVGNVERMSEFKIIDLNQEEENFVQENVMENQNLKKLVGKIIHNILMVEQKNIPKHFIFQLNGEDCEKRYMKEIIGFVKNAEKKAENCMPIIKFQLENVKILLENQILLPYVENVIKDIIVLNNRQEVQNEFYK